MPLPNPLHWLGPPTPEEASARVKNRQPSGPGFGSQVVETIGTILTAIGRTFGTTVVTPPVVALEYGGNLVGRGVETVASPFYAIGKIANTVRTKAYNLLGGHWF